MDGVQRNLLIFLSTLHLTRSSHPMVLHSMPIPILADTRNKHDMFTSITICRDIPHRAISFELAIVDSIGLKLRLHNVYIGRYNMENDRQIYCWLLAILAAIRSSCY
ncbi:hypothetical protein BLOT_003265 [Blomia tropicalis]|nr:hypothetical protein BLOT_003265 [Blomia tropicalis]